MVGVVAVSADDVPVSLGGWDKKPTGGVRAHFTRCLLTGKIKFVVLCSIGDGRLHCCRKSESSLDNVISSWFLVVRCSVVLGSCSFVEKMPWRSWSKWPLCIALEKKRCFLTWDAVMFPGKECSSPASMALQRVDMAGNKRVAWKKAMRADRCGSGNKALDAWDGASAEDELIVACGSTACEKLFTLAAS